MFYVARSRYLIAGDYLSVSNMIYIYTGYLMINVWSRELTPQ